MQRFDFSALGEYITTQRSLSYKLECGIVVGCFAENNCSSSVNGLMYTGTVKLESGCNNGI
jgi:hypothetical protein